MVTEWIPAMVTEWIPAMVTEWFPAMVTEWFPAMVTDLAARAPHAPNSATGNTSDVDGLHWPAALTCCTGYLLLHLALRSSDDEEDKEAETKEREAEF